MFILLYLLPGLWGAAIVRWMVYKTPILFSHDAYARWAERDSLWVGHWLPGYQILVYAGSLLGGTAQDLRWINVFLVGILSLLVSRLMLPFVGFWASLVGVTTVCFGSLIVWSSSLYAEPLTLVFFAMSLLSLPYDSGGQIANNRRWGLALIFAFLMATVRYEGFLWLAFLICLVIWQTTFDVRGRKISDLLRYIPWLLPGVIWTVYVFLILRPEIKGMNSILDYQGKPIFWFSLTEWKQTIILLFQRSLTSMIILLFGLTSSIYLLLKEKSPRLKAIGAASVLFIPVLLARMHALGFFTGRMQIIQVMVSIIAICSAVHILLRRKKMIIRNFAYACILLVIMVTNFNNGLWESNWHQWYYKTTTVPASKWIEENYAGTNKPLALYIGQPYSLSFYLNGVENLPAWRVFELGVANSSPEFSGTHLENIELAFLYKERGSEGITEVGFRQIAEINSLFTVWQRD